MKRIFYILLFLPLSITTYSQQYEGVFKEGGDVLKFENEKVYFNMNEMGNMITNKVGEGSYEILGDYLLVKTGEYSGEKSSVQPLPGSKEDSVGIKVTDNRNFSLPGILVELLNSSGKTLHGGVTDSDGKFFFKKNSKGHTIKVSDMGYDNISFAYDPTNDFLVKLVKNDVIENQTVVFKLKKVDDETLSVLLLSTDFNPGKNQLKALEKLDKKARKSNYIDKYMKKEYEPYQPNLQQ
ncbi:MAG: hypothetical protein WBH96_04200 [Dysgonamonadaceae bacterium]